MKIGKGKHPNCRNGFKKGRIVTKEERIKTSERNKKLGIAPPSRKGSIQSKKFKKNMSKRMKGNQYAKGNIPKQKGKTKKEFPNLSNSGVKKGNIPWNKDKKNPKISGKKHPNWQGGKSFEPYTTEFNKDLKQLIKKRDNYQCVLCKSKEKTVIHHIDYDKKNCSPDNLLTLCMSCHSKTNFKREFWELILSRGTKKMYKHSLAELIDRVSIVTLKSIFLGCNNIEKKKAYEQEAREIMNDIHILMLDKSNNINHWGELIRAIQLNMHANYSIWINETKARQGGKEQNHLLPLTHTLNGLRQKAGNTIQNKVEGRIDLNLDRVNYELMREFGYDFGGIFDE